MGRNLQGILIRKRRLERNWSQSTLCSGICVVSYLSKIEQGRVEGTQEVLLPLLQRLDIPWREDPVFCRETAAWFADWYERLFSGEDADALGPALQERREEFRNSPFFLDWLLLTWLTSGEPPEDAADFIPAMDNRQYNLYLFLTEQFQELLRTADQSYYLLGAGAHYFDLGQYGTAVDCLQTGMNMAVQEGSLPVQMMCCGYLGNCYSCLNQLEQTRKYYSAAIRMARILKDERNISAIAYNLAATEMLLGMMEEALGHLLAHPWNEGLYYHKLAACYEALGRKEEALAALEQAAKAPLTAMPGPPELHQEVFDQACQLLRFRLQDPHFLKNPEYGNTLISCMNRLRQYFPSSFIRFHARWLEEWYTANRQYQKANEVLWEVFLKNSISQL